MQNTNIKKKKSPFLAFVLSGFIFAGAGQVYMRRYLKGLIIFVSYGIFLSLTFYPIVSGYINYLKVCTDIEMYLDISTHNIQLIQKPHIVFPIISSIIWLFAVIDAYVSAKKHNRSIDKLIHPTHITYININQKQ